MTQNAIEVSQFPPEVSKWIFAEQEDDSIKIQSAYNDYITALSRNPHDLDEINRTKRAYYKAITPPEDKQSSGFRIVTD